MMLSTKVKFARKVKFVNERLQVFDAAAAVSEARLAARRPAKFDSFADLPHTKPKVCVRPFRSSSRCEGFWHQTVWMTGHPGIARESATIDHAMIFHSLPCCGSWT